jgi:hypothetical protein
MPNDPLAFLTDPPRNAGLNGHPYAEKSRISPVPEGIPLATFLNQAKSPEFLIDPIIQRGFLYTLTAMTFHGKTTLLCYTALCVALAHMRFCGLHTEHGRFVLLAGENPDDTANKFIVGCDFWGINPNDVPITILPGAFDLESNIDATLEEIARGGPVVGVGVDTSAAYRFGENEDDNQKSKAWGQTLRRLTTLPGKPAVIVPTHPIKHVKEKESLIPRGGGAFLNEVDGNLALWSDLQAGTSELHWQGKFRGPSFAPINFDMRKHPHPTWRHHDGRPVEMVAMVPSATPAYRAPKAVKEAPQELGAGLKAWHDALLEAIENTPATPGFTTMDIWFDQCAQRGLTERIAPEDNRKAREAKRGKFRTARGRLVAASWIKVDGQIVCDAHPSDSTEG